MDKFSTINVDIVMLVTGYGGKNKLDVLAGQEWSVTIQSVGQRHRAEQNQVFVLGQQ